MKTNYLAILVFSLLFIEKILSEKHSQGLYFKKAIPGLKQKHLQTKDNYIDNSAHKNNQQLDLAEISQYQIAINFFQAAGTIILLVCTGLVVIGLLIGGVYFWMKQKEKKLIHDYAMNPDQFMPKPNLSFLQKIAANSFQFNTKENFITEGVICKKETNQFGTTLKVIFQQNDGLYHSILGSTYIETRKDNVYFEITVDGFQDPNFDVVIGFSTEKNFLKDQAVGDYPNSVGFHTSQCLVKLQNQKKINYFEKYGNNCLYGETIGVGYRPKDGRVWFTHNGKFLNEMLSTEKVQKKDEKDGKDGKPEKKQEEKKDKNEHVLTEEEKQQIIARDQELKEEIVLFQTQNADIYPVISAVTPVMLTLNFGATNFRLFQKEIAQGLL